MKIYNKINSPHKKRKNAEKEKKLNQTWNFKQLNEDYKKLKSIKNYDYNNIYYLYV